MLRLLLFDCAELNFTIVLWILFHVIFFCDFNIFLFPLHIFLILHISFIFTNKSFLLKNFQIQLIFNKVSPACLYLFLFQVFSYRYFFYGFHILSLVFWLFICGIWIKFWFKIIDWLGFLAQIYKNRGLVVEFIQCF